MNGWMLACSTHSVSPFYPVRCLCSENGPTSRKKSSHIRLDQIKIIPAVRPEAHFQGESGFCLVESHHWLHHPWAWTHQYLVSFPILNSACSIRISFRQKDPVFIHKIKKKVFSGHSFNHSSSFQPLPQPHSTAYFPNHSLESISTCLSTIYDNVRSVWPSMTEEIVW